jgi:hypothetical protein
MKYTLNVYGWEGEFVCKSITHEETKSIDDLKEKIEADDYWEIRFDLDTHIENFDIYDGDILHMSKPLNNGTAHFELHDENQEIVLRFTIDDINPTEYDNEYDVRTSPDTNVYCSIDESKGGINSYEIESDSKIYPFDFTFTEGIILLPNGEFWSVIDQIYFKGEEIEPYDHLDNYGKSSTLHIFKHQE